MTRRNPARFFVNRKGTITRCNFENTFLFRFFDPTEIMHFEVSSVALSQIERHFTENSRFWLGEIN